jgi:DNA-binding CsgD family transcriptional regulator
MKKNKDLYSKQSSIIKKIWNEHTENPSHHYEENGNFLKLKNILDTVSIGEYFFYVVNLHVGEIEHTSPSIESILGYKPEDFNLELYVKIIHPDDLPYLIDIQKDVSEFTIKNISKRIHYKFCYDFRIKDINDEYHQVYIQHFYAELSESFNPQRALSLLTDITHIKKGGNPKLNIFKLGDGLVKIINKDQVNKIYLTNKENEIFDYLIKGFTSKDISEALNISKHTVDTHRRNILKRNNCSNTSELLSLYFETKIDN